MGSDAEAYIFDDTAYGERVVPGLRRFVHLGTCDAWLDTLLRRLAAGPGQSDFAHIRGLGFSFDAVCDYLGPDFAFTSSEADPAPDQWSHGWDLRACRSRTCPATSVCPLHRSQDPSTAEEFNVLVEACVVDQCLGPGQFLGRSVSPTWYLNTLARAGVGPTSPLYGHLGMLEHRGFVVGYQFANSDGIHVFASLR